MIVEDPVQEELTDKAWVLDLLCQQQAEEFAQLRLKHQNDLLEGEDLTGQQFEGLTIQ